MNSNVHWLIAAAFFLTSSTCADDRIDYLKVIKPLFRNKCSFCHGALCQEGELWLDAARFAVAHVSWFRESRAKAN